MSAERRSLPAREPIAVALAAVVLGAAFVWLPAVLVGGATTSRSVLHRSTADAVAGYWHSGRAPWTNELGDLVSQWRYYHLVKAVIAAAAVVVFGLAVARRGRLAPTRRRSVLRAAGTTATCAGALVAVLMLIANVQGAIAPFASLLSLLPTTTADSPFAPTLSELRDALGQRVALERSGPLPLERMIDSFAAYHVVLAVLAGVLAVLAAGLVVRSLMRRRRVGGAADLARRPSLVAVGAVALLFGAAVVLCLANVSTALRPVPALRDVFAGQHAGERSAAVVVGAGAGAVGP